MVAGVSFVALYFTQIILMALVMRAINGHFFRS